MSFPNVTNLINITLCSLLLGTSCLAHAQLNLLVFPEIKLAHESGESFSSDNITPSLNIFAAGQIGPVIVLSEAYFSESLQHIERLQIGFNIADSTRLWFGRHHNAYGYWHTQYHHGTFLQTSISRPSISELGAAGGVVPSHSTGMLIEGDIASNSSAWHYDISIGLTSNLDTSGGGHHGGHSNAALHDFEIFSSSTNDHNFGYTLRLSYFPDALAETQIGGFINHNKILIKSGHETEHHGGSHSNNDGETNDQKTISLDVLGLFANYQQDSLRIISEAYYFSSTIASHSLNEVNTFYATYLQLEYALNDTWTPYFRIDKTYSHRQDAYLTLLDGYRDQENTLGLRFDFSTNNAIKLEYSSRSFTHNQSGQWALNWSAVW